MDFKEYLQEMSKLEKIEGLVKERMKTDHNTKDLILVIKNQYPDITNMEANLLLKRILGE